MQLFGQGHETSNIHFEKNPCALSRKLGESMAWP